MNNKALLAGIVLLVVVLGGLALVSKKSNKTSSQTTQPTQLTQTTSIPKQNNDLVVKEVVITVTKTGFKPQTVTVKTGTRLTWINKSGADVSVNSDDHPTHLLYREFNLGAFPVNSSVQLVTSKPGKYTYHDHLNPDRTGTVIVE